MVLLLQYKRCWFNRECTCVVNIFGKRNFHPPPSPPLPLFIYIIAGVRLSLTPRFGCDTCYVHMNLETVLLLVYKTTLDRSTALYFAHFPSEWLLIYSLSLQWSRWWCWCWCWCVSCVNVFLRVIVFLGVDFLDILQTTAFLRRLCALICNNRDGDIANEKKCALLRAVLYCFVFFRWSWCWV